MDLILYFSLKFIILTSSAFIAFFPIKREFDENTESPELSAISGALAKAKPEEKVDDVDQSKIRRVKVFCVPLGDLVRALAWTRIDFLSLDAEGSDLDILRTFPWQLVDVRVR